MSLNSVNTNIGAKVALQSLNRTSDELAATQKRISTAFALPMRRMTAPPSRWRNVFVAMSPPPTRPTSNLVA
jgi:hypothetical protein